MSSVCVEAFSGVAGPFLPFFGAARAVVTTTAVALDQGVVGRDHRGHGGSDHTRGGGGGAQAASRRSGRAALPKAVWRWTAEAAASDDGCLDG